MSLLPKKTMCLLAFCLLAAGTDALADSSAEVAVKAAVVHKISRFVTWPESAFAGADSPVRVCVVGRRMMVDAMRKLDGRPIHGRHMSVRSLSEPAEVRSECDVLYLGAVSEDELSAWIAEVANSPVLTFGDRDEHSGQGSIVNVAIRRNKVRFAIDTTASDRAGLEISAQLLQLSAALGPGGPRG